MSEASAAADQVTREMIQLAEAAVKLSAAGLKNLAALALAMSKDKKKLRGKARLSQLLREGSELRVIPLPKEKMANFADEAKRYGIVFASIQENRDGTVDHLVRAQDAAKINRVFERIDYHGLDTYKSSQTQEKNQIARAVSENDLPLYGQERSSRSSQNLEMPTSDEPCGKLNVRERVEQCKQALQKEKESKVPAKTKAKIKGKQNGKAR